MYNDLVTKALDQAKALQKTVVEAVGKGADGAQPLIGEAVTKANVLRETLVHGAVDASEQARPHLENALTHVNGFIAMSKDALATSVAKAQDQLGPLTEQVRKTIESTTAAVASATTGKKPEDAAPEQDAAPH